MAHGLSTAYDRQVAWVCHHARTHRAVHQINQPLNRVDEHALTDAVVLALGAIVETRDRNTLGHSRRLAAAAAATGVRLGFTTGDVRSLFQGGYLHDLGKIAIPDRVLLKPGPLTQAEFVTMKLHTVIGDALCGRLPMLHQLRPIVRWHHERLDGTGFPDGLSGDRIPLLAQVVGIADVYDALTSARPYKSALSPATACEMLMDEVKRGWRRRDLVEAFMDAVAPWETGRLAA